MSEEEQNRNPFKGFQIEIDPEKLEEALAELRARISESVTAGRYTKVRLSYRGKQIGPDLPLAVFLAGEGVAFWVMSPLGALLMNLGAKAFLDVEFIHQADELVQEGIALYMEGELDDAEAKYREALKRRPDDIAAMYNLGVLLRVTGRKDEARKSFEAAAASDSEHPDVQRAAEAIEKLDRRRDL